MSLTSYVHHWRVRALAGVAVCALMAGGALAQTDQGQPQAQPATPGSDQTPPPEVVVTGTHIRGVAPVGSSLIAVTRKDIENTTATTVEGILQQQPQILNFGVTDASRSGTGGAGNITYANSINLRSLSPYATLTLFDGYRIDPAGTVGTAVDPNTIPAIMLQRVDIVADGASATYGSDAIAGVVNLIPRRNFEGEEVQARGGWADGYSEYQADAIVGHNWGSGQFTAGFEYDDNSALNGADRSYYNANLTSHGYPNFETNDCAPGTIVANGTTYAIPAGGATSPSQLVAGTQNLCQPLKYEDLLPQQTRYDVAATFNQDITPWLHFFADGIYSMRDYERKVPLASGPLTVTSANPYYVAAPGNTSGVETVDYWFGDQGLGNTYEDHGYSQNYNLIGGFNVDLPYDWHWNLTGTYGHDDDLDGLDVTINESEPAVAAALASTNPATALNLFGSNSKALLTSLVDSLSGAPGHTSLGDFQTKFDGPLFTLPGGQVKAAVGYEWEYQSVIDGLLSGTPQSYAPLFGGLQHLARSWDAFYGEIFVPLVGPQNNVPLVRSLDLDAGVRYTDYQVVGSTTNPKIGINWTINDDLKLHASWGTSFRAPQLSELVGPVTGVFFQQYATATGPVSGYTLGGGNTSLKPETATTWSIGGDLTPSFAPHLKVSVNYFNIDYTNQIASYLSNLNILENPTAYAGVITWCSGPEATTASTAQCQGLINKYVTGPNHEFIFGPTLGSASEIGAFVNGLEENLGTTETDGLDFTIAYAIPGTPVGDFNLGLNGTYFLSYKQAITPNSPLLNVLNTIDYPIQLRFRANAEWVHGPWDAVVFVNYEDGYTNNQAFPVQQVSSWTTVDLHLGYDFGVSSLSPLLKGTRIAVDVTNLFDTDPPFVAIIPNANGGGGFDPNVASPIGRLVAVTIDKKF